MKSTAAGYIRRHSASSSASMTKWRCGCLPNDGGDGKRGFSLRGSILYREFITQHGLIIGEGFNDVIGLDNHGIPALDIMSNRMTELQGEKISRFAKQLGINRINLMFDCDEAGTEGAKEALLFFAERQVDVRLVWSRTMHESLYSGRQPESLSRSEVDAFFAL